jgi:hypothetical protein
VNTKSSLVRTLSIAAARVALVCALVGAGWNVYRQLPEDVRSSVEENNGEDSSGESEGRDKTRLRIVLRVVNGEAEGEASEVEIYSVDTRNARVAADSARRQENMPPIPLFRTRFNEQGEANIVLAAGRWRIHATHANGAQELVWRLPVRAARREQTVILTPENAYMRTQRF